jgi:hypothetical protein
MTVSRCLSDGAKHRWRYRDDSMLGRLRECAKCGVLEQRIEGGRAQSRLGRWHRIGSPWREPVVSPPGPNPRRKFDLLVLLREALGDDLDALAGRDARELSVRELEALARRWGVDIKAARER